MMTAEPINLNLRRAALELAAWQRLNATIAESLAELERQGIVPAVSETGTWDGRR